MKQFGGFRRPESVLEFIQKIMETFFVNLGKTVSRVICYRQACSETPSNQELKRSNLLQ